ncbi:MAG: hypothetical protein ABR915_01135 [Thermoguttaceae bacterium]|jgi:hypothetical protein
MTTRTIVILLTGLFVGTITVSATEPRNAPAKCAIIQVQQTFLIEEQPHD